MSIISKDYVTYQTAAEKLSLTTETVRKYILGNVIHAEKVGRTYYIHQAEIQRFLDEKRPVGRPAKKS